MFDILALLVSKNENKEWGDSMEQTFGSFVRQHRQARGMTLRGLAAALGISPVYMSNIETDRRAAPTQEYLEKLAKELMLDKASYEEIDVYKRQAVLGIYLCALCFIGTVVYQLLMMPLHWW